MSYKDKYYDPSTGERKWNMNEVFIFRLDRRTERFQEAYTIGDLRIAYRILKNNFSSVSFLFKDRREYYKKRFYELRAKIRFDPKASVNAHKLNSEKAEDMMDDIFEEIQEDLHLKGLIFPKNKEWDFKEAVESDFE